LIGPAGVVFFDWQPLGQSKDRASRGKNDSLNARRDHGIEQVQPVQILLRKYFDGSRIDSPTSAFAAKCITASGARIRQRSLNLLAVGQLALNEVSA